MANSPGYPNVIAVRKESGDIPTDLTMPDELEGLKVALYVWDPDALDWVRMRQPQISPLADALPMDQRYEWQGTEPALLIFKGIHPTHKALTSDTHWFIWKFSYSGGNMVRQEGPLEGSWDNRAGLGWG